MIKWGSETRLVEFISSTPYRNIIKAAMNAFNISIPIDQLYLLNQNGKRTYDANQTIPFKGYPGSTFILIRKSNMMVDQSDYSDDNMGEKKDYYSINNHLINKVNGGFVLPKGHTWDPTLIEGKKEGKVIVKDQDKAISHVLYYENDKLNGVCEFYDVGTICEKRTFVNDVEEGWACDMERNKDVRWYWYVDGVKKAELKKCKDLNDYWEAADIITTQRFLYKS